MVSDPDSYHGAIPISPAGPLNIPVVEPDALSRPLFILYGTAEGAGVINNVQRFQREFERSGGAVQVESHPGGHRFPGNWPDVLKRALNFLQDEV